ncbi:MAG: hypothetical protein JWQ41_926 [Variovorax sp.]|nr:hypothetical protein [Variovorax sp.]
MRSRIGLQAMDRIVVRRSTAMRDPSQTMISPSAKEVFIQGLTSDGRTFRPSDWAERLAGVMSSFRPGGATPGSHLSYSPWCVPTTINGTKCVVVHTDLKDHNVMAWDFVMNFARDNGLQIVEACLVPDMPPPSAPARQAP